MQFLYSVYQTSTDIREVLLLQNVVRCNTHLSHVKSRHVHERLVLDEFFSQQCILNSIVNN